jgi:hypothetical protein
MRLFLVPRRAIVAAFLLLSLAALPAVPLFALPATTPAASSAPIVWPMSISAAGGKIVLYEPQVRTWPNYTQMTGIAAVAVTLPGAAAPVYGTLTFTSLASADVPSGMVSLVNPKVNSTAWPTAAPGDATPLDAFLKANLHLEGKPLLPLAMVIASVPKADRPKSAVPVRTNPPVIYVSQSPAVLVVFDGKPAFSPIPGTSLTYAVNTNWEIVHDPASSLYYVHAKSGWYSSPGASGPFTPTVAPASFAAIPATGGPWSHLKAAAKAPKPAGTTVPKVIVSTVPAALIDIHGPPQFANVAGTQLRYVTNTKGDLFFSRDTLRWYVLLSGRWFSSATNLNGPWAFASTSLPADFKKIPDTSPKARVLVSVPGTTAAFYAAQEAQVPRVVPADPTTQKLTVTYASGTPVFAPIAGTSLAYAQNTSTDVIQVDPGQYFACADGVWFTAGSATGPWVLASYVPAVIYTIPQSSPLYHVTFVHVYDSRGVALTAPKPTPAPKPGQTYENIAPSQLSQGDAASYYYYNTAGYLGGYAPVYGGYVYGTGYYNPGYIGVNAWITNPPTYGNYNDTTYARQQAQSNASDPRHNAPDSVVIPPHGPRSVPGPNTNIYAADDGVYKSVADGWQKNGGGETWTLAATAPISLKHDRKARLDGYDGTVSEATF